MNELYGLFVDMTRGDAKGVEEGRRRYSPTIIGKKVMDAPLNFLPPAVLEKIRFVPEIAHLIGGALIDAIKTIIPPQTAVWTTKTGREVRVKDMDDTHLAHTINLLRCNASVRLVKATLNGLIGIPKSALERVLRTRSSDDTEVNQLVNMTWVDFVPEVYNNLVLEFIRRGLDPVQLEDPTESFGMVVDFLNARR